MWKWSQPKINNSSINLGFRSYWFVRNWGATCFSSHNYHFSGSDSQSCWIYRGFIMLCAKLEQRQTICQRLHSLAQHANLFEISKKRIPPTDRKINYKLKRKNMIQIDTARQPVERDGGKSQQTLRLLLNVETMKCLKKRNMAWNASSFRCGSCLCTIRAILLVLQSPFGMY